MDATRRLTTNTTTEREEHFGDWLRRLQKSVFYSAVFVICVAIRFMWSAISVLPYSSRMMYVVVPFGVSIVAWVIIIMLVLSELPMERRGWMSIYQRMVDIAGVSFIIGLGSVLGIGLGMI